MGMPAVMRLVVVLCAVAVSALEETCLTPGFYCSPQGDIQQRNIMLDGSEPADSVVNTTAFWRIDTVEPYPGAPSVTEFTGVTNWYTPSLNLGGKEELTGLIKESADKVEVVATEGENLLDTAAAKGTITGTCEPDGRVVLKSEQFLPGIRETSF